MKKYLISIIILFVISSNVRSQIISFDSGRWEIKAKEKKIEEYLGRQSLYMQGGFALIKDSLFTDGIIEFDIAFTEDRGFFGAVWRVQDLKNYEEFYVRSHQSDNVDANQYTPVFNDLPGWQLYHGEGYSAPVKYSFNEWIHVKIIVSGKFAEIFIRNMDEPVIQINELKREVKSGQVGLKVNNFAGAHFSNFSYSAIEKPTLKKKPTKQAKTPKGTIKSWFVSNVFDERTLKYEYALQQFKKDKLTWTKLECEKTGIANLARIQGVENTKNTVYLKITIMSEKSQVKKFSFGYSDRVFVYLDDMLFYSGTNSYKSRDYRYLGTIGLFDELYLPLKQGANELLMAVSESFGGWGVIAKFEDMKGIEIVE